MFDDSAFSAFNGPDPAAEIDPMTGMPYPPGAAVNPQALLPPPPAPAAMDPMLKPPTMLPPVQGLDTLPGGQVAIPPPPSPPPIRPPVSPTMGAPSGNDQTLGAAISGANNPSGSMGNPGGGVRGDAGAPLDITSDAQKAGAAQPGGMEKMAKALQGVKAPAAPEMLKIAAPHLPQHGQIKTGQLAQLFAALNPQGAGGMQLPQTLNAALRRG